MLGTESIGILEIGIDGPGAKLYLELKPAELVVDSTLVTNSILNDTTPAELEINLEQVHNILMYEFEVFPIIINVDEQSNRSASDQATLEIEIGAEQTGFSRGFGSTEAASIEIGDVTSFSNSIGFFTFAELVVEVPTYNAYYTFNIQEYEQTPMELTIGGTSIDYFLPVSQGGPVAEIPQIWIG